MQSMQKEDLRFKASEKCYEDWLEAVINYLVHHKAAFPLSTKGQYMPICHKEKMLLHLQSFTSLNHLKYVTFYSYGKIHSMHFPYPEEAIAYFYLLADCVMAHV